MIFADENGLIFEINQEKLTSKVIYSPNAKGDIIIPKAINYNSKECIITAITEGSFKDNKNIKSINFSEDSELLLIESNAFYCSSLQSISFQASLKELQENWCAYTLDLNHISVSPKNKIFSVLNDKIIIGKSNFSTNNSKYDVLFFACRNISTVKIPSSIKCISSYAFNGCMKLKTIEISEDSELETIEYKSFGSSSLESIKIPAKVSTIKEGWCIFTFFLNTVSISPKNGYFKYIENSSQKLIAGKSDKESESFNNLVFACRDVERAFIPSNIKHITSYSFQSCLKLNVIEFEENSELQSIGDFAFSRVPIDEIIIPQFVHSIGEFAFCNCPCLQKVDLSKISKLKSIKKSAFENTGLTSIVIPACVEVIEENAFSYCHMLTRIEFSEGSQLHSIGNAAFGQTSFQKILIPKHVTHIGEKVFVNMGDQLSIEFEDDCDIEFFDQKSFNSDSIVKITIPKSVIELKDGWCEFTPQLTNIIISPENENLTYVSQDQKLIAQRSDQLNGSYDTIAFACRNIREAVIPSQIKRIASNSFDECKLLNSVEFERDSQLISIGNFAFRYSSIEKVSIPNKVKFIGESAFFQCIKLAIVDFVNDSDLISIGNGAFSHSIIGNLSIPKNIKEIGDEAFCYCQFLNVVEVFGETFSIGNSCFYYCRMLTVFSMPNAKEVSISKNAFVRGFENLTIFALATSKITFI